MLERLAKIAYVFLITFLGLGITFYILKSGISLDFKVIYLLILLGLPFFDKLLESVKKDFSIGNTSFTGNNFYKYIILALFSVIAYFYGISILTFLIILFILFSILFKLDARVSFIIALFLLIGTASYLLIGDKIFAENLSIYAYYFLIIGVVLQISENIFSETSKKKASISTEQVSIENKNSYISEIQEIFSEYFNILQSKISQTKKEILKEIGEDPSSKKEIPLEKINKKLNRSKKIKLLKNKINGNFSEKRSSLGNNVYIKLTKYFLKKINDTIHGFVYLLFIFSSITLVLSLHYKDIKIVFYTFISLIIIYFYSKILGTKYSTSIEVKHDFDKKGKIIRLNPFVKNITIQDIQNNPELLNESTKDISLSSNISNIKHPKSKNDFFFNKAIFFASLGLIAGYFLIEYFQIKNISNIIYISIFILFFFVYYLIFSNLDKKIATQSKGAIQKFSFKVFIKKHIYFFLNFFLITSILIVLGFRTDAFQTLYKQYLGKVGFENWQLTREEKDKIIQEKREKLRIELEKQYNIISNEVQIEEIIQKELKPISEIHTFTRSLSLGDNNEEVEILEGFMKQLGYFEAESDNIFDDATKEALTSLLKTECDWPETTKGILGTQAMQCLYSLEIEVDIEEVIEEGAEGGNLVQPEEEVEVNNN